MGLARAETVIVANYWQEGENKQNLICRVNRKTGSNKQ